MTRFTDVVSMVDAMVDVPEWLDPPALTWRRFAACRGHDPDLSFPQPGQSADPARTICHRCPVAGRCLQYALSIPSACDVAGVYGGKTPAERKALRRQRKDDR